MSEEKKSVLTIIKESMETMVVMEQNFQIKKIDTLIAMLQDSKQRGIVFPPEQVIELLELLKK